MLINIDSNLNSTYLDKWQPVTSPEIKRFIGILFLMGIIYKPQIPKYWSANALYNTPIFPEVKNRNRSCLILNFFISIIMKIQTVIQMTEIEIIHTRFVRLLTQCLNSLGRYILQEKTWVSMDLLYSIKDIYISNSLSEQKEPNSV